MGRRCAHRREELLADAEVDPRLLRGVLPQEAEFLRILPKCHDCRERQHAEQCKANPRPTTPEPMPFVVTFIGLSMLYWRAAFRHARPVRPPPRGDRALPPGHLDVLPHRSGSARPGRAE